MEEKSAKKETDEGAQCTDDMASPTELKEMPEKTKLGFNAVPEKLHWRRQFNGRHTFLRRWM